MKEEPVFLRHLLTVTYILVFLRFLRDQSLLNALLAVQVVSLTKFTANILSTYFDADTPPESAPALKKLLAKALYVLQLFFVLQTAHTLAYHAMLDLDADVCRWVYGYLFTDLLGEFDCKSRGRSMLFVLDALLLLCQLQLATCRLVLLNDGRRVSIEHFSVQEHGILSILKIQAFRLRATDWEIAITTPLRSCGEATGRSAGRSLVSSGEDVSSSSQGNSTAYYGSTQ
ncbi:AaceriAAR015Cp [[Ashbya] aceris (nom. inval.)]|nr:AaceriAAR015Cp [[Ashbya] aceris (nom. inval.)]